MNQKDNIGMEKAVKEMETKSGAPVLVPCLDYGTETVRKALERAIEGAGGLPWLKPGMKPEAVFKVTDKPVAAYEYCNLHGLWMAEV